MQNLGEAPRAFHAAATCQHQGKVLNFSEEEGGLMVTEILLGGEVQSRAGDIALQTKLPKHNAICCCSLGDEVLVLVGKHNRAAKMAGSWWAVDCWAVAVILFLMGWGTAGLWLAVAMGVVTIRASTKKQVMALLVQVRDGEQGRLNAEAREIGVIGGKIAWPYSPFLCQTGDRQALLYSCFRRGMWNCEVNQEGGLSVEPADNGKVFLNEPYSLPVRLPNGEILVAEEKTFALGAAAAVGADGRVVRRRREEVDSEREGLSVVLVGGRFLVGFGVRSEGGMNGMSVYDTETRRSSGVTQQGEWHPEDEAVPLMIRNGRLYLLGGKKTRSINAIGLRELAEQVEDRDIRRAMMEALGAVGL